MTPIQIAQLSSKAFNFFLFDRSNPSQFFFPPSFSLGRELLLHSFQHFFLSSLSKKIFVFFLSSPLLLSFFSLSKEKTRKSVKKRLRRAFLSALSVALFQRGDALALDCSRAFVSRSLLRRAFVVNDG